MSGASPSLLWRVVRTDPPTEADFVSNHALGLPRRGRTPPEIWAGLSAFDAPITAAGVARRYRRGEFLAGIALDPNGPIHWAKTRGEGHYTIWGTPGELLACVVATLSVSLVLAEESL